MIRVAILTERSAIVTVRRSWLARLFGARSFKRRAERSATEFGWSWTGSAEVLAADVADEIWNALAAAHARFAVGAALNSSQ